jgi:surfactin synthase thioesterase subunit
MKKLKLFCFPYAGGSGAVYNKWRKYLDKRIELAAVELAGRGRRIYDPLYDSTAEAVEDVYGMINSQLNGLPYSFFGHSMGGIIAYELARKLKELKRPQPVHIFFAGRGAPHVPAKDDKTIHQLPEQEFKKEIIELGGTPAEFFEHPELLDVLLPMIRSDFKISENYTFEEGREIEPLAYDMSVFIGKQEEVTAEQVHGWKDHTTGVCTVYYFEGEHFFINHQMERVVKIVNRTLLDSDR